MRHCALFLCTALFCGGAVSNVSFAATYRGQALDAVSGEPVDGAGVSADATPTNGVADAEVTTGYFGVFDLALPGPGEFVLSITHPGYLPHVATNTFAADDSVGETVRLTPRFPGGSLQLLFQVNGAFSGLPLDDIPVSAPRHRRPCCMLKGMAAPAPCCVRRYSCRTPAESWSGTSWICRMSATCTRHRA